MSAPTQVATEGTSIQQAAPAGDPFRFGWRYVWRKDANGLMAQVQVPLTYDDILHPQEEDFIVNMPAHARDCFYLENALQLALAGRDGVEVLRDVRVDWQIPGVRLHGPDLSVFVNVPKGWKRDVGTFRVKDLGARPILVIEVTSPTTRSNDLNDKVEGYFAAGVPFYAIADYLPELDHRQIQVLGYRATPEGYVRVGRNEQGQLWMEPVGLWLASEGDHVLCFDERGGRIPDIIELDHAVRQAELAAKKAQQEVADLTERLAAVEAELQRLRGTA